jgi:hypothetical protein
VDRCRSDTIGGDATDNYEFSKMNTGIFGDTRKVKQRAYFCEGISIGTTCWTKVKNL